MNQAYEKGSRAGMNTVSFHSNPYPKTSPFFHDWNRGHTDGRQTRLQVMSHEHKLYRSADPARFQMLWG